MSENIDNMTSSEPLSTTISVETSSAILSSPVDNFKLLYSISVNNIEVKLFIDVDGKYVKLFKHDVELTKDITNAINAWVYDSEHWSYKDDSNLVHLFKNNTEITKDIRARGILRHPQTGQWIYADEKNKHVLLPVVS